ncbi:MAG: hypothetical protein SPH93_12980 [Clostridium sp.]|uniref:hypothetical protein n=1 Tax=Clostridium sp. TaxID=1506 RepID=UPI002A91A52C|nr:hypothetical protein [Clostridium sp.]MDY6228548.1 hypothetical protein [Clostridium sp.]
MKKIRILLILLLSIFLVSCGSSNISAETTIVGDSISKIKIILSYDSLIKSKLEDNIINDKINSYLVVKSSYNNETNMYVDELVLSREIINYLLSSSKLKDYLSIKTYKSTSLFKNIYTFDIKFLSDLSSLFDSDLSAYLPSLADSNLSAYLRYIPFSNKIIIPGKILSSNANNVINEDTLEWTYTLDQINSDTNLQFEYEDYSIFRIMLFILFIIALLTAIIYVIKRKKATDISKH